jgi:bidirectional [NiFe] hydrogenase diaphorase subunit
MSIALKRPPLPSADKRWKIIDATMRRHGYDGDALIESLHTVQESFGFIDDTSMRFVAGSLNVPLSRVFGVATFYHIFSLKPQGKHTCVVCLGTACYIKGAPELLKQIDGKYEVKPGETTANGELSLLSARCIGSCGLAPAVVIDGEVLGRAGTPEVLTRLEKAVQS